jgi:hypothetical protein
MLDRFSLRHNGGRMDEEKRQLPPWLVGLVLAVIVFVIALIVLNALGYGDDPAVGASASLMPADFALDPPSTINRVAPSLDFTVSGKQTPVGGASAAGHDGSHNQIGDGIGFPLQSIPSAGR